MAFSFKYILYNSVCVMYDLPGGSTKFYGTRFCQDSSCYTKVSYENQQEIPIYLATSLPNATKIDDILGEELGLRHFSCCFLDDNGQNVAPAKANKVVVYCGDDFGDNLIRLPKFGGICFIVPPKALKHKKTIINPLLDLRDEAQFPCIFAIDEKTVGLANDRFIFSSVDEIAKYETKGPVYPEPHLHVYAGWDLSEFATDDVEYHYAGKTYIFEPQTQEFKETNSPRYWGR